MSKLEKIIKKYKFNKKTLNINELKDLIEIKNNKTYILSKKLTNILNVEEFNYSAYFIFYKKNDTEKIIFDLTMQENKKFSFRFLFKDSIDIKCSDNIVKLINKLSNDEMYVDIYFFTNLEVKENEEFKKLFYLMKEENSVDTEFNEVFIGNLSSKIDRVTTLINNTLDFKFLIVIFTLLFAYIQYYIKTLINIKFPNNSLDIGSINFNIIEIYFPIYFGIIISFISIMIIIPYLLLKSYDRLSKFVFLIVYTKLSILLLIIVFTYSELNIYNIKDDNYTNIKIIQKYENYKINYFGNNK